MSEKLIRAFFAAEIDEDLRSQLAGIIDDLGRLGAQVRWVRPENLHWTVKFLGDVPLVETGRIAEAAKEACSVHEAFGGRVVGVGPFPPARRMRMVAARMEDGGSMGAIRDELEPFMEDFGVAPDGRGFKAHLTLGRVRGPRRVRELAEALGAYASRDFGECWIEELVLFQSELSRSGPTYTPLARIPLASG
ncbi:MAG: RNA 2',3'-cyclic phosphodiesterase [Planctomycetota bacterium]|jgi:2'-5' RNA ligase